MKQNKMPLAVRQWTCPDCGAIPSDVRFYLATGIFLAMGIFVATELAYAWMHPTIPLRRTVDAFGLFDAAIFALLGTVLGFYFASKSD